MILFGQVAPRIKVDLVFPKQSLHLFSFQLRGEFMENGQSIIDTILASLMSMVTDVMTLMSVVTDVIPVLQILAFVDIPQLFLLSLLPIFFLVDLKRGLG